MGTFQFQIPAGRPIADIFASAPPGARAFLRRGFTTIAALSTGQVDKLLAALLRTVTAGGPLGEADLMSSIGDLSAEDAKAALAAGSFLAVSMGSSDEPIDPMITAAVNAKIVAEPDADGVRRLAALIARDRSQFRRALAKQELAASLLPSLAEFHTVVDIRPSFGKKGLDFALPVILVHIDTDTRQEIWFQASKGEVENLVKGLQEALQRVEEAEKWQEKSAPPPS